MGKKEACPVEPKLTRQLLIRPSLCDHTARLGVADAFAVCMDLATEHANALGIGVAELSPRHLFWLTVKTRLVFTRRPAMNSEITGETWPEPADRIRCNRDYVLRQGGEALIRGKTEWAVLNTETGSLIPAGQVFPPDLVPLTDRVWEQPFARLKDDFIQPPFAGYTVRSTDIDLGGHMNNVAYVRALAGAFSTAEWDALPLRELEIHFKSSCYEGDELAIQRRTGDGGALELRMSVAGRTAVLARIM